MHRAFSSNSNGILMLQAPRPQYLKLLHVFLRLHCHDSLLINFWYAA